MRKTQEFCIAGVVASLVVAIFMVFVWIEGGYSPISSILRSMGAHFATLWLFTFFSNAFALFLVDIVTSRYRRVPRDEAHAHYNAGHLIAVTCVGVLSVLILLVVASRSASY